MAIAVAASDKPAESSADTGGSPRSISQDEAQKLWVDIKLQVTDTAYMRFLQSKPGADFSISWEPLGLVLRKGLYPEIKARVLNTAS
jgi:hypothetical protein